jgi:hypothetical protein
MRRREMRNQPNGRVAARFLPVVLSVGVTISSASPSQSLARAGHKKRQARHRLPRRPRPRSGAALAHRLRRHVLALGTPRSPPGRVKLALDAAQVLPTAAVAGPDLATVLHPERPAEAGSGLILRCTPTRRADRPLSLLLHPISLRRADPALDRSPYRDVDHPRASVRVLRPCRVLLRLGRAGCHGRGQTPQASSQGLGTASPCRAWS